MRYLPALADLTQLRHQAKDLLHAAQRLEAVRALVSADTDVNTADAQWHRLPLHTAAEHRRPASVRLLLELGADPDLRDPDHGRTPLEWCQPENRYLSRPGHDEVDRILRPVTTAP
jgi:ankyrin repeat protein